VIGGQATPALDQFVAAIPARLHSDRVQQVDIADRLHQFGRFESRRNRAVTALCPRAQWNDIVYPGAEALSWQAFGALPAPDEHLGFNGSPDCKRL